MKRNTYINFFIAGVFLIGIAIGVTLIVSENKISRKIIAQPRDILVQFKPGTTTAAKNKIFGILNPEKIIHQKDFSVVVIRNKRDLSTGIESLKKEPLVIAAQPNYMYHISSEPASEPLYSSQWSLSNTGQQIDNPTYINYDGSSINNPGKSGYDINIKKAWDVVSDASSIIVAVIDTGVRYNHEDLSGNMWDGSVVWDSGVNYPNHGYDFTGAGDNDPMDDNGHGTLIAGIIGASGTNGLGGSGICRKVQIMAVKAMDASGNGSTADVIKGIDFAASHGAKIICLSLSSSSYDPLLYTSMKNAKEMHNVLFVAAAGNNGVNIDNSAAPANPEYDSYPCEFDLDNIVCVAAVDQKFQLAKFSNYGTSIDIAAPGTNIVNTWPGVSDSLHEDFYSSDFTKGDWTGRDDGSSYSTSGSNWKVYRINDSEFPVFFHYYLGNPVSADGYRNDSSDRVWKLFTFGTSADVITSSHTLSYNFADTGDSISYYINNVYGSSPTKWNSTSLSSIYGGSGTSKIASDITSYVKGKTDYSLMFLFETNLSGKNVSGATITDLTLRSLTYTNTSYIAGSGTSYSAAHVAGVSALLFSYNSEYTYADVIRVINKCGKSMTNLDGKIKSGGVLDAAASIEYLDTPEILSVEFIP
jgi:thermitase